MEFHFIFQNAQTVCVFENVLEYRLMILNKDILECSRTFLYRRYSPKDLRALLDPSVELRACAAQQAKLDSREVDICCGVVHGSVTIVSIHHRKYTCVVYTTLVCKLLYTASYTKGYHRRHCRYVGNILLGLIRLPHLNIV